VRLSEQVALRPRVWLYASFPTHLGGGNPAGVVGVAEPIPAAAAQSLAALLSVPTTGFVLIDEAAAAGSASVRFFTPQREIDACGHVTIAIATALADCGIWRWGSDAVVRARGGEFPLRLRDGRVEMDQRLQALEAANVDWGDVKSALGPVRAHPKLPIAAVATGLRHLIVPVADTAALGELALGQDRITALAERSGADTVCVWAREGRNRFRVRDLCARIGALEEPGSGTTCGALGLYLARNGQLYGRSVTIDQGVEMGRPCRIEVVVTPPATVTVRGGARRVLAGTLDLPPAGTPQPSGRAVTDEFSPIPGR